MGIKEPFRTPGGGARLELAILLAAGVLLLALPWFRAVRLSLDPQVMLSLDMVRDLIALTILANLILRFKGTRDPVSVVLALGILAAGIGETVFGIGLFSLGHGETAEVTRLSAGWFVSRTLLPLLLLCTLLAYRRIPGSVQPAATIGASFTLAAVLAALVGVAHAMTAESTAVLEAGLLRRPWQLLPAMLFLLAAVGFRARARASGSAFDGALALMAALNVFGHLMAAQSAELLNAPFVMAQLLNLAGFALVLGGALLDNSRLFQRAEHLAMRDPLTGLANYRRFSAALQAELQRAERTGRTFSVVLLDLDGLKKINDRHGHLEGSRALCRLADVLRMHSRAMDTAARFGGDEFVLILPETEPRAAVRVAERIRERLAGDGLEPPISASAGVACYPEDGETLEALLDAADRSLYEMKRTGSASRPVTASEPPPVPGKVTAFPAAKWAVEAGLSARTLPRAAVAGSAAAKSEIGYPLRTYTLGETAMPKTHTKERIEPRVPMEVSVEIYGNDEQPGTEQTFTENVSSCGARVLTQRRWRRDDCLQIVAQAGSFRSRARVAYCQPVRGEGFAIGLEFLQTSGAWVVSRPGQAGVQ